MYEIKDYHRYTTLMKNGFYDKLFFVDKLFGEWKTFLDFGCADGFLTKLIAEVFPDKGIIGYDISPEMISRAISSGSMPGNVMFTTSIPPSGVDVIYFCSVLHEINEETMTMILEAIRILKPKYIIIRDMEYNDSVLSAYHYHNRRNQVVSYLVRIQKEGELERFEALYGNISLYPKSFAHFLLKYPYIDSPNWERELNEDYFNIHAASLIHSLFKTARHVVYKNSYNLPYLEYKWAKDVTNGTFVSNYFTTHKQLIFQYEY